MAAQPTNEFQKGIEIRALGGWRIICISITTCISVESAVDEKRNSISIVMTSALNASRSDLGTDMSSGEYEFPRH